MVTHLMKVQFRQLPLIREAKYIINVLLCIGSCSQFQHDQILQMYDCSFLTHKRLPRIFVLSLSAKSDFEELSYNIYF